MILLDIYPTVAETDIGNVDSGSTNNPVLRFLLFIPRADRRPLVLEDAATDGTFGPRSVEASLIDSQ